MLHSAADRRAPSVLRRWLRRTDPKYLVTTEQRVWVDDRGIPYGAVPLTAVAGLEDKGRVQLVARLAAGDVPSNAVRLFRGDVSVVGLPSSWYGGPAGWGRVLWQVVRGARVVAYLPGVVGALPTLLSLLARTQVVVVVVGDPERALAPDVIGGWRSLVARPLLVFVQKWACSRAAAVRYVTEYSLQRHYPPGRETRAVGLTDVVIDEVRPARSRVKGDARLKVVTVASLDRPYKGISDLLRALAYCSDGGLDVHLTVVGDGALREALLQEAEALPDLRNTFLGQLDRAGVDQALASADLFVLASWTEGQPRALLEAMAAGLPVVATAVGGVPELLPERQLSPPRDPRALAEAIGALARSPEAYGDASRWSVCMASRWTSHRLARQHSAWLDLIADAGAAR